MFLSKNTVCVYSIPRIKLTTDKPQSATETVRHDGGMKPRIDLITASRVDLALLLLPVISWLEASCMLAVSGVPAEVAARVLVLPGARRAPAVAPAGRQPPVRPAPDRAA
jgi:hypothetical protein